MEQFGAGVRKLGIADQAGSGPTAKELARLIECRGLNARLSRKRIASTR
jgi:hypothetical protein